MVKIFTQIAKDIEFSGRQSLACDSGLLNVGRNVLQLISFRWSAAFLPQIGEVIFPFVLQNWQWVLMMDGKHSEIPSAIAYNECVSSKRAFVENTFNTADAEERMRNPLHSINEKDR